MNIEMKKVKFLINKQTNKQTLRLNAAPNSLFLKVSLNQEFLYKCDNYRLITEIELPDYRLNIDLENKVSTFLCLHMHLSYNVNRSIVLGNNIIFEIFITKYCNST